jgi:acyl carrier protein
MSDARAAATRLLAEALQIDPTQIDDGTALGITPEWDSLAHMRLVVGIETHLARQLRPEAIVGLANLSDLVALLERSS